MKLDAKDILARYTDAKNIRMPFEPDWREVAGLLVPRQAGLWNSVNGSSNVVSSASMSTAGEGAARRRNFDITGIKALPKYTTVLDRILTPRETRWHGLKASDPSLMKQYRVKQYFEQLTNIVFSQRYSPRANFESMKSEAYTSIGVYGTAIKFITTRTRRHGHNDAPGLLYRAVPLRNCYMLRSEEEQLDTMFRRMDLNARKIRQKFLSGPNAISEDSLPEDVKNELKRDAPAEDKNWEIVHVVGPNDDYDNLALDIRRFPFISVYIFVKDKKFIGKPEGFLSFPYVGARDFTAEPGDAYGYSRAQQALGAMGMLNAMKKTIVKQGQKAADPVLLLHDDGVVNGRVDLRPGAQNFGGVNAQGQALIHTLPTGDFNVAKELLEDERNDVNETFFASIFQMLVENPDMTATAAMDIVAQKAALCAPLMGRMQSEDLGPMIEREIDILARLRLIPPMPPELEEARGDYEIQYTSPLALAARMDAVNGYIRLASQVAQVATQAQQPQLMNRFNFDAFIPEAGEISSFPLSWLHSDDELQQIQQATQDQQQTETTIRAAPALAGAAKAVANMSNATQGGPTGTPGVAAA